MLFNGIVCLITATILLFQIKRTQHMKLSQSFQKFIWIYWAVLMIISIQRIFSGFSIDPWVTDLLTSLNPVVDMINATGGLFLAYYLHECKTNKTT